MFCTPEVTFLFWVLVQEKKKKKKNIYPNLFSVLMRLTSTEGLLSYAEPWLSPTMHTNDHEVSIY